MILPRQRKWHTSQLSDHPLLHTSLLWSPVAMELWVWPKTIWAWLKMSVTGSVVQASLSSFQWPWQYDFPPFFTLQTNSDTRSKQTEAWCDLVLDYYRHIKSYSADVNEALSSPLFYNSKINRIPWQNVAVYAYNGTLLVIILYDYIQVDYH